MSSFNLGYLELINIYVSSFLFCSVISEHPPELPLKTFSLRYRSRFSKILSLALLELPHKWLKLELIKTSQKPNLITISNNLSKIKPFSDCVLQFSKISSTLSKVII